FSGFVACTLTNPIWFVKTRLQLDHRTNRITAMECVRRIYRQSGILGFYKGIMASYIGISETVIHFMIYEAVKTFLASYRTIYFCGIAHDLLKLFGFGSRATHQFVQKLPSYISYQNTLIKIVRIVTEVARTRLREEGTKYQTFFQTVKTVYNEEKLHGLYRGLYTHLIRQIPNTAIIMATYEAVVYLLSRHFHEHSLSINKTSSSQFYTETKGKRELA
ncbi:Solute carrier family 25 member 36, partial [Habropoda laboriosa]